ncbi:TRAP transporter small permease subunit [Sneathiella sp.]|uniref:TRAP transporter small permease subunit n=1 Tax=Sneathiella sp. TaxID=1964365 RepID=UPI00356B06F7
MIRLASFSATLDHISASVGKYVCWLSLLMVLLQFMLVVARYVFGIGAIAMQETIIYCFGLLFLLGAADTLRRGGHVRVDIFYARGSAKIKAVIDLLGTLFFLIPVCVGIFLLSWSYVAGSWHILEGSRESTGLPFLYLLKSMLLLFCVMMTLQGISTIFRSLVILFSSGAHSAIPPKPGASA